MEMKKTALVIATAASLTLGAAVVLAHGHGTPGMHPGGASCGGMVMQRITRMLHRLDLSDGQREKVHAILEAARPEFRAHMESLRAGRQKLWNLDPGTFDEARVRELARARADEMVELMVLGQKVRSQVWAVLTPEQREKAAEMRGKMRERMKKSMRHCREEAGGPPAR